MFLRASSDLQFPKGESWVPFLRHIYTALKFSHKTVQCFWKWLLWKCQNIFFLGPYPVGKTAKTSFLFRRALTVVSHSGFNLRQFPWDLLSKINQSEFCGRAASGMKKMGFFIAGVPSSLAHRSSFSPWVLASFPLSRLCLLRRIFSFLSMILLTYHIF